MLASPPFAGYNVGMKKKTKKKKTYKAYTAADLKRIRLDNGWTVQEMADILGTSIKNLERWLGDKSKPNPMIGLVLKKYE
jgi:DNA-binding transcriptional regulator YiaG